MHLHDRRTAGHTDIGSSRPGTGASQLDSQGGKKGDAQVKFERRRMSMGEINWLKQHGGLSDDAALHHTRK